jgi:hypothetical protein
MMPLIINVTPSAVNPRSTQPDAASTGEEPLLARFASMRTDSAIFQL